ncbi:MAG: twin-arginine translocation signal domain-containing protein, partial [Rhodospirillales bacterium]|nr:twin-arginine translocation signal domain-containing protein [Rhodospirillales bacterium]
MMDRRQFLQVAAATAALTGAPGTFTRVAAKQTLTQNDLLSFKAKGQVTLLNFTDCHAQLAPIYFREPSVNLGVGEVDGLPPHLTGKDFIDHFQLAIASPEAYALSSHDFSSLAKSYGRVGGMDRMATLIKAIRAERPDNTLLLDGGDTWQGSYTSLHTQGADMVEAMHAR